MWAITWTGSIVIGLGVAGTKCIWFGGSDQTARKPKINTSSSGLFRTSSSAGEDIIVTYQFTLDTCSFDSQNTEVLCV
jgi:hypothetical protein